MAPGKCRHGRADGAVPSAEMLMEVRRLLDEGALRASRAQRSCTGVADCCRFRLTGETPHVTLGEAVERLSRKGPADGGRKRRR